MNEFTSQFKWKNFDLNMELHIAGDFIYEGIYLIDRAFQLKYQDEYFLFLYNISVGIERLEKIAYLLLAHRDGELCPTKNWENHNHPKLIELINYYTPLKLGKRESAFVNLLSEFYNKGRYDRFKYVSEINGNDSTKDKDLFIRFLRKHLNVTPVSFIGQDRTVILSQNVKNSIGNIIRNIAISIYDIIHETASILGLYTYEIRYDSKAYKVFVEQEFSFIKENTTKREIILHMVSQQNTDDEYLNNLKQIKPINLEQHTQNSYIGYLMNSQNYPEVKDEVVQIYEDEHLDSRVSEIDFIGDEYCYEDNDENVEEINITQFNVEDLFETIIYKNGNKKISIRPLDNNEIKLLCNILHIFKYQYNGEYIYLIIEDGRVQKFNNLNQLVKRLLRFIEKLIYDRAMSREYRNIFLTKWDKLIPISMVRNYCPLVNSYDELDHEVGMSVDSRYRNIYYKDCLINYLKNSGFIFVNPKNSTYGYYYKKAYDNEYVVVDIVKFDDDNAQYIFDLLVVPSKNNSTYPIIYNGEERTLICNFNIFKHRNVIDGLFQNIKYNPE